ncbi:hypothetical protein H7849_24130 [Alloacidobacterium dinghuense]|uniref:Uncharacterized protein n=1 Tax=Alloacidobacterium dinghuense TaxID=2763107 RepID=A0A7G8BHN9_9BACT|nr:hypothetical protein [Alloacidobacterium dinghuense]QNI32059.1 hypothetical protein H7849_24130 [Alloacidobacterium dinghuense]
MSLLLFVQAVPAAPAQTGKWFTAPAVAAAVITSILTIGGIVLKDYLLKLLEERRSEEKAQSAIYERYSHPLVSSAVSLMNRLHEILYQQHRPVYLLGEGLSTGSSPGSIYRSYKKLSTIYRLAAMLGWIRACRREFSYLRVADIGKAGGIHRAIDDFENSLADGNWVEWQRITRLCDLWLLCKPGDLRKTPDTSALAAQVDNLIWNCLENENVEDVSLLPDSAKRALCRTVADCLSSHLRTNEVAEASMQRSWPDAFAIIGMREAWIYRDWQSGIGDMMIRPTETEERRFEVIGFGDFEHLALNSNEQQPLSLNRLFELFDNLNLSIEDRFDARPTQLKSVATATARLILEIDKIQGKQSIVSENSRERADEILRKLDSQK